MNMSVLHGKACPISEPSLLHEIFKDAVEGNSDKAQTNGVFFEGTFHSYRSLRGEAEKASVALKKRLRNRIMYDRKRPPCTKCRHQSSNENKVTDTIIDIPQSVNAGGNTSNPVDIPTGGGRLEKLRGRLRSVPPTMAPVALGPTTGSYDERASEEEAWGAVGLDYQAACIIAIDVSPGPGLLTAILASLSLGAAYLPIDSQSAINRVKYILGEAAPLCILADADSTFIRDTETVWSRYHVINVSELLVEADDAVEEVDIGFPGCTGNDLLSVIYTSGSSGMPKGVQITHRAAMNRLTWQWAEFPFHQASVGCFKTSLLFVDSIIEIFSCLLQLVPLVIAPKMITSNPEAFVQLLEEYRVTRLVMVPSLLRSILMYISISGGDARLKDLTLWVCNSETLVTALAEKFFAMFKRGKRLCNFYGSTESMADVTAETFTSVREIKEKCWGNSLSVGRPMFNSSIYIVDESLEVVQVREVGEICISGLNIADGYLDDVASEAFIRNPFSDDPYHKTLYKSGDFGRLIQNSSHKMVVYEGRRDLQVKIRGQRVNIAEIERVVAEVPFVERVTILVHRFSPISEVIVAYYTTKKKTADKLAIGSRQLGRCFSYVDHGRRSKYDSEIAYACQRSLPPYMRPKLLHLEEIPLQPHTGKVDRVALRKLYEKAFNRQSSQELAILDKKSQKAMNIIALNLNLPTHSISKSLSFFQLGGTSITMMSTIVQLKEYGLHIPIELFSSAKSIQEIIDHVIEIKEPIGEILRTDNYVVLPMHEVSNNEVIIDILADSFTEKEPLDVLLGITKKEFIIFARSLYKEAARGKLSLVVIDKDTRRIVGGDFLFDYFRGLQVEHHETMTPILTLFQEFETPIRRQLADTNPGPLMLNYCLCVLKDLPHAEQVKICHLIEGHVIQIGRKNGYIGVVTNNTNPVTQDICQHFYDYEILSTLLVRDFQFNGRKVFSHAPEEYKIKMMLKYI